MLTDYDRVLMNLPGDLFSLVMAMDNSRMKTFDEIEEFKDRIITLFRNYPDQTHTEDLMEKLEEMRQMEINLKKIQAEQAR